MMVDADPMSIAMESETRSCKARIPRNAAVFRMNAIDYCFLQLAKISKVGRLVDVDFKNLIRRYSESKSN
jgi:hypothetical protein